MRELFREVASLVVYNPQLNKFLVQDRTSISKYGEEVSFFGGGLDEGETPLQAAKRESLEELGRTFNEYIYIKPFIHDMNGKDYIRHLFFVTTIEEDFNDLEWDGGIWITIKDMKSKKFITDISKELEAIKRLIEG